MSFFIFIYINLTIYMKPFKYFDTLTRFNTKKVSTNKNDSAYRIGNGLEIVGDPEILWNDLCFIEDKQMIWNHGDFFLDLSEIKDDITDIQNTLSGVENLLSQI